VKSAGWLSLACAALRTYMCSAQALIPQRGLNAVRHTLCQVWHHTPADFKKWVRIFVNGQCLDKVPLA
jgi:hypothetical protein